LTIDENRQTMSVGSRDWIEASKDMKMASYLPTVSNIGVTAEPVERETQVEANPRNKEDSDRFLGGMARNPE
jgi:hypothetical protein